MTLSLQLCHSLACDVCEQNRDEEAARAVAIDTTLFGAVHYAICPCCSQRAPHQFDRAYRQRVREFLAGERPEERPGLRLYARRSSNGEFRWVYRERLGRVR